jgi:hypothetical protein
VAGSFVGPWFLEIFKERNEKKKKRAEKIEELVAAVYEFDHWLDQYRNITAYGNEGTVGVSPLAKMEAIAATHFPDFLPKITQVSIQASGYKVAIAGSGQKRLAGKISEVNDGLIEAQRPYAQARNELLDELKTFAGEQLK